MCAKLKPQICEVARYLERYIAMFNHNKRIKIREQNRTIKKVGKSQNFEENSEEVKNLTDRAIARMDTAATDPVTPVFNLPKPVPASSGPLASSTSGLPRIKEENQDPPESNEADSDNVEEDEVELTGETDDGDRILTSAKRPYIPPLGRRPYGFPKIEGLSEEDADVLVKQFWHERRVEKKVNGGQCVKSARQKYRDKVEQEGKLPFSETQYVKAVMKQYKTKTIRKAEFEFQWFASLAPSHPLYCPEPSLEL